ncbi:MAG: diguanylate cyclase [Candidatus Acidiferrales bacterium]
MPASRKDENRLPSAVLVLFVFAAVATFIASACSMSGIKLLSDSNASVAHANTVLDHLDQLRAGLLAAQQARGGYRLGQEPGARADFVRDYLAVHEDLAALRSLTEDNLAQSQRIAQLEPLVESRLAYLRTAFSQPASGLGVAPPSPDAQVSQQNFAAVAESNRVMDDFQAEEDRLLAERDASYHRDFVVTSMLVAAGSIFGPAVLLGLFWLLKRENERYRRTSESLRESRENFQMIVDQAQDYAILLLDARGRVTAWNKGAERIKGYREDEILGKSFTQFFPPDDVASGKPEDILLLARAHGQYQEEGWRVRKDGSRFWADVTITALRAPNGALRGYSKLTYDATERRANEIALQEREEHFKRLSKLGEFLHSCRTVEEAYRVTQPVLRELFPSASGGCLILSGSQRVLETLGMWGERLRSEESFAPENCWALRLGRIHLSGDSAGVLCPHFHKQGLGWSNLCIPLNAQGDTIGVLVLSEPAPGAESAWTDTREAMAAAVAQQFALALANLQLRDTLLRQSIRDPLTGLHNRRYLEEVFERELHRAVRRNRPLAVLMVDIDHFKKFNDEFGHAAGDMILREVGAVLRSGTRAEDATCRYGGDEFVLLLTDSTREGALMRARHVLDEIRRLEVREDGELLGSLTVSIGVATFPENGSTPGELIAAADQALYDAKDAGRDRVATAHDSRAVTPNS